MAVPALDPAGFATLLVEERADRVVVLLNRPEVRNAIDQQMVDELHRVCAYLEQAPKVLIIAGTDGVFASGADIAQLRERRRDDALQGITDVVRGRDLFAATAVHRVLQTLLGLPAPRYHHHALILDADGRKLSKSAGDVSLARLRDAGWSPADIAQRVDL